MSGVYHTRWETGTTKRRAVQGITKPWRKKYFIAIATGIGSACASGGELGRKRFSISDESQISAQSSTEAPTSELVLKDLRINLLELVFGRDSITVRIQLANQGSEAILCQPNAILFAYNELEHPPRILEFSEGAPPRDGSQRVVPSSSNGLPLTTSSSLEVAAKQKLQLSLRYQIGKEVSHRSELVFRGLFVHDRWLYSPRLKIPARGELHGH